MFTHIARLTEIHDLENNAGSSTEDKLEEFCLCIFLFTVW